MQRVEPRALKTYFEKKKARPFCSLKITVLSGLSQSCKKIVNCNLFTHEATLKREMPLYSKGLLLVVQYYYTHLPLIFTQLLQQVVRFLPYFHPTQIKICKSWGKRF